MALRDYSLNIGEILTNLTPIDLREPTDLVDLQVALCAGYEDLNNSRLVPFIDETREFFNHDSRKIYLEKRLNDLYDSVARGIFITNTSVDTQQYLYNDSEGVQETYIYNAAELQPNVYLYNAAETLQTVNFVVNVPNTVTFTDETITGLVNKYVTSGKTFSITRY